MVRKPEVVTMPLAQLTEDWELYPRHAVDDAHVRNLFLALEAGCELPPLVADRKSKRITDGWHRGRARKRRDGADAVIEVELVDYKDEDAMVIDAIQRNSAHGRKLDAIDQTRSVVMLEHRGISPAKIALAMHIPEARVEKIRVKVGRVRKSTPGSVPGTDRIVLKRPVHHMAGTTLTNAQAEVHKSLPGTSFLLIARQLRMALEQHMVDFEDKALVSELSGLHDQLTDSLAAV